MKSIVVIAALGAATGLSAAQIINGGFEDPGTGFHSVPVGASYGGWTNAGPGNIEFVEAVANGNLPHLEDSAYEGRYWIDLVGTQSPSAIYQDVAGLEAGQRYRIDWAQSGNVWGSVFAFTMEVVWNGQVVASYTQSHGGNDGRFMNWQEHSVEVIANSTSGSNRLMFRAVSGGSARGPALDAVNLTLVPAPGAAATLLMGGVVLGRRRR